MCLVYLVRHGQAGTRQHYDQLSDLGRSQSESLGKHFYQEGLKFSSVRSGYMVRHFQTAQILAREVSYENGVVQDPLWNDCELTLLWDALAPALKLRDPDFAAAVASERHSTPDHRVSVSDLALVDAWLSGRAVSDVVPAWDVFRIGVETALEQLFARGDDESVLVVTSSKPIAAICLKVLGLPVTAFAGLASSFYNASVTIVSGSSSGLQSVLAMNENYFRSASLRTLR